jgi:hypothetical protein
MDKRIDLSYDIWVSAFNSPFEGFDFEGCLGVHENKETIMAGIIFLLLPLSVILVFALAGLAFADVAIRGAQLSAAGSAPVNDVSRSLQTSARQISSSLQRLTADALQPASQMVCHSAAFVPSVTEPEAKAIAEELQQRGGSDLNRVMQRSRQHGQTCPMRSDSGVCLCAVSRPLSCLGRCVLGGDSPESTAELGDTIQDAFRRHLASRHANAGTNRLDEALVSLLDRPNGRAL